MKNYTIKTPPSPLLPHDSSGGIVGRRGSNSSGYDHWDHIVSGGGDSYPASITNDLISCSSSGGTSGLRKEQPPVVMVVLQYSPLVPDDA